MDTSPDQAPHLPAGWVLGERNWYPPYEAWTVTTEVGVEMGLIQHNWRKREILVEPTGLGSYVAPDFPAAVALLEALDRS